MINCIFCKIINGDILADKIYEDDKIVSFMDISPVSRGHALVVPKIHTADIVDTDDAVLADVIAQSKKIAVAIQHSLEADGFTISTNRGEAAGQTVFHLHFHIIPRYHNDGLKPWVHREQEPQTRAQIAEKIKKQL